MIEVELTDVGKRWLQDHYPQGIVWEYDVDKPFKLQAWAAEFIELTCLGIPYRIPPRRRRKTNSQEGNIMGARDSLEDRKAEAFLVAMIFFGFFLHEILPFLKGEAFLLCVAIGFAGGYHEKRTGETWDILIKIFKKFLELVGIVRG